MRNTILFIIALVAISRSFGQSSIDSLENELRKNQVDSVRVRLLISLSREYQYLDFQKSKHLADSALTIAERKKLGKTKTLAYQNIGILYTLSGDYSSALRYDNLALEQSLSSADSTNIIKGYSNVANDYHDLGEYDEAYYYFAKSYSMAKALNDSLQVTIALHNVGRVFKELGQYERALRHLELSRHLSETIHDIEGIPYSQHEIGDVMLRKRNYDTARLILTHALKLTRKEKINILEPRILTTLASTYLQMKDFKTALAYYDSTYTLHKKTNNRFGIAEVELGRGLVYMQLKNYNEALMYINRSLAAAREMNARILEISCFNALSRLLEQKGDYKQSLAYFRQYKQLEDSLFSQDMQEKLLRDQIRFETEAKDTEIAEALSRVRLQDDRLKREEFIRNILVVVMALSGVVLFTVYRSGQRRRQINALLLQHQVDMEKRSEELERLNQVKDKFFSIISHDLRSPVNALAGLLDLLDKGAVSTQELPNHVRELKTRFNHTRTLLNNLLDWTLLQMDKLNLNPAKIDLHKIVEENIQLIGSVQNKQIKLLNQVPNEAFAFADSNTVNLVIRNLLTNAIKFTNDGGQVELKAELKTNEWLITVQDNGIGMNEDVLKILFDKTAPYTTRGTANEKGTGLGLILCKEFVEKNGGKIWVESKVGEGSKFYFTLPKAG